MKHGEFVKMPGYHHPPERKGRTQAAHGGVLTYIHKDINYYRRDDLESSHTETIWMEVVNENTSNILICTVYRPEKDKMPTWSKNFESEMEAVPTQVVIYFLLQVFWVILLFHQIVLLSDINVVLMSQ